MFRWRSVIGWPGGAVVPDAGGEGQDLLGDAGGHAGEAASAMKFEVELVVLEATGDYWKPPFYPLEDEFRCWLLDAKQDHLPGRPKTDGEDVIWLAKVAERGMARPSSCRLNLSRSGSCAKDTGLANLPLHDFPQNQTGARSWPWPPTCSPGCRP